MIWYKSCIQEMPSPLGAKMGQGSPVCQQMCEQIIEMFKKKCFSKRDSKGIGYFTLHGSLHIKRFKECGGISVRKGQGCKPKQNNRDLRSLRRHCIKNRHSPLSDITTWAQDYFGKPMSSTTIRSYIHKWQLKLYCAKRKPYVNLVDFSGLRGIWDGPSNSGNVCCGQTNHHFRSFLEEMDAVCAGPKKKRTFQTVTS